MAKKEVEVCKLEEPLICQWFPHPEPRCQGARFWQLMKSTQKCLKLLPLFRLHRNSSSLLNFTQCHSRHFSLGIIPHSLFVVVIVFRLSPAHHPSPICHPSNPDLLFVPHSSPICHLSFVVVLVSCASCLSFLLYSRVSSGCCHVRTESVATL